MSDSGESNASNNLLNSPSSDPRRLDLTSTTSLVAASMIGAGVYTTSGFTLADLGSPWRVIAAWAIGGVIAICGAICYGSLARSLTDSGGEYLFLSRKLHPVAGLMAGWVSLLAGFTGAIAFAATTFETYLGSTMGLPSGATASMIVIAAAILHTVGVRPGARVQDAVVILKFFLIGAFVIIALRAFSTGLPVSENAAVAANALSTQPESTWQLILKFAKALVWISLSYSGFNAAVYVAGEVKNADRTVPRALLFGTVAVTICYLVLNSIFVLIPPPEAVAGYPDVAAKAAEAIGGPTFASLVRIVILFGLFTSVSAMVMSGPRVYAKMADDGFLPAVFRFNNRPPTAAIWAQAFIAIIVIYASTLEQLLSYLSFTLSICAALTASLLFWVRDDAGKRIRGPLFPIAPLVYVGGTLTIATVAAIGAPVQAAAAAITILFGALLYPWIRQPSE